MRLLLALLALTLAGCPPRKPAKPSPEPLAEPAPVEIDWPDAGPSQPAP